MMMKRNELINKAIVLYTFLCITYQIAIVLMPIKIFFKQPGWNLYSKGLCGIGLFLLVADLLTERLAIKGIHNKWLFLLLGMAVLSSIVRYQYRPIDNIKTILWNLVQITLIYTVPMRISRKWGGTLLLIIHSYASILFIPALLYMFYQFLTLQHYVVNGVNQGWFEGRLFGIMNVLYNGTILVALLLFGSVYLLFTSKRTVTKIWYVIETLICFVYIALSDTRTIFAGIIAGVFSLFLIYVLKGNKGTIRKRIIYSLAFFLIGCLCFFGAIKAVRTIGMNFAAEYSGGVTDIKLLDRPKQATLSSRRVFIWKSYCEILLDCPSHLIIGFSPEGYHQYIMNHYPESYVVTAKLKYNPLGYQKGDIYGTHNAYLHVLVTSGVFGLIALLGYLFHCCYDGIKYFISGKGTSFEILLFSVLALILTAIFFEGDVFFKTNSLSFFFWLIAGMFMNIVYQEMNHEQ